MRPLLLIILLLALGVSAYPASADDASLEEIVVTAARRPTSADDLSTALTIISGDEVSGQKLVTDALSSGVGTYLQQTTPGQGAAIVRGLKGSSVLHLVDGVRLNNALFRSAPTQYLSLVPTTSVERIEVIRGTPTSLYGSDAVGGVIQLVTRVPTFEGPESQFRGNATAAYDTAESGRILRATVDAGNQRVAGSFSAEYMKTGDRRVGGGQVVSPTGYESKGVRALFSATPRDDTRWLLDVHWLEQPATPRVDELVPGYGETEPSSSEYLFNPNARGFVHGRYTRDEGWFGLTWNADLAWQRIDDDRTSRAYQSDTRRAESNRSDMYGAVVNASRSSDLGSWIVGAEYYDDRIASGRTETDLPSGQVTIVASRFPDGSQSRQASLFGNVERRLNARHSISAGLRYSDVRVDLASTPLTAASTAQVGNVSGDLGWIVDLNEGWQIVANVGRGFRAPNVFDMGTLGDRPGNRFNIPNSDLSSEHVLQADFGVRRRSDNFDFEVVGYSMRYDDRITSVSTGLTTPDGRDIVQSSNAAESSIRGIETGLNAAVTEAISVRAVLNYTWGLQVLADGISEPADRIPPLSGSLNLRYDADQFGVEGWLRYASLQDRLSARDVGDSRVNPEGTSGWGILGAKAFWTDGDRWTASLGLDNILDKQYRVHGSGIDAPGRSLSVSVGVTW